MSDYGIDNTEFEGLYQFTRDGLLFMGVGQAVI